MAYRWLMQPVVLLALIAVLLAACESAEPTPFPAEMPVTPTPTPQPTARPPARYALDGNMRGAVPVQETLAANYELITLDGPVDPARLGADYDIGVAYGAYSGFEQVSVTRTVTLVVNPDGRGLTPEIATLMMQAVDPAAVTDALPFPGAVPLAEGQVRPAAAIRIEMANLGHPDGVGMALGVAYVPGADAVQDDLAAVNVATRPVTLANDAIHAAFDDDTVQAALVTWTDDSEANAWEARFGADYTRDLYTLPISYVAVDALAVDVGADGWPLPRWEDANDGR